MASFFTHRTGEEPWHSNKIEGNQLTKGQTEKTISTSMPPSSTDEKEAVNLKVAFDWVLENASSCIDNFVAFTRETNKLLREGIDQDHGSFRRGDVKLGGGVSYVPPPWGSVDEFMATLGNEIRGASSETSPLELAVRVHTKFVAIHPFVDGNGRTARLIMAAILISANMPLIVLNSDDKARYLKALEHSNTGSLDSILILYADLMEETLSDLAASSPDGQVAIESELEVETNGADSHTGKALDTKQDMALSEKQDAAVSEVGKPNSLDSLERLRVSALKSAPIFL